MKKILYSLVLFPMVALAQTTTENYVKSTTYKQPSSVVPIDLNNPTHVTTQISYFDGLGRPIQQIAHKQSATGKDIVTHIEYDSWGRQIKEYLPFIPNSSASLDIKTNETMSFYSANNVNLTADPNFDITAYPYSEKLLEKSPLNRVFRQSAPGNDWALNQSGGADHSIKFDYQTNTQNEVKKFRATTSTSYDITFVDEGHYPANELYKTITKNENWTSGDYNTTHEFKDKEGRVILKRTFGVSDPVNSQQTPEHDTFYIYDEYGNLTYVLPPLVDTTSTIDQAVLDNLCYQYKYDGRNRLIEKKLPGKQWEFIVYDKLDRVVATGPTLSPFTDGTPTLYGWIHTKYDAFDRVILTAWADGTISSYSRSILQGNYDSPTNPLYETRTSPPTSINNVTFDYTTVVHPISKYHVLTVNYYDDYDYPNAPTTFGPVMHDNSQAVYYNNTSQKPKGLPTGNWVRILENSNAFPVNAEVTSMLYDNKGRAVRTHTTNYLSGYTQIDTQIDFSGKVHATETRHKRTSSDSELYVREEFKYTPQDRLQVHTHQIGLTGTPQVLAQNQYSELGQLLIKQVGGPAVPSYAGLQKVNYKYNIRGWLTAINDVDNLTPSNDPQDLFAFKNKL